METTNASGTASSEHGSGKPKFADKYTRQPYPALVKPAPNAEADESDENEDGRYRALVEYREKRGHSPRFHIIDRRGCIYGCGYAYLLGWFYTPPETLSIQTTTHVFTLTGTGLEKIEQSLLREKVKELREFHPGQDQEPETGQPIITGLNITSPFEKSN